MFPGTGAANSSEDCLRGLHVFDYCIEAALSGRA